MTRRQKQNRIACEFFTWVLFQRDGVYYADGRTGNLGKHSLATKDYDEAIANLRRLDRTKACQRGLLSIPEVQFAAPSIPEGWERFLEDRGKPQSMGGVAPLTIKRYKPVQDHHIAFCSATGTQDWAQVNKENTERFGRWLAKKHAPGTMKLELELVISVVKFLVDKKALPPQHAFTLKLSKPDGTERYCFLREEVAAMLKYCQNTPGLEWFAPVITGLATTGLRSATFCGLRRSEIDLASGTIRIKDERFSSRRARLGSVRTLKGKRDHALPLHPSFRRVLEKLPQNADGLVFHGPLGGRLHPRNVLETLQTDVIEPIKSQFPTPPGEIGFEHGVVHSFRHFFCSEAFRQGANEAQVLEWLGNRDSNMIRIYRHLREDDSKRKMNTIDFLDDGTGS